MTNQSVQLSLCGTWDKEAIKEIKDGLIKEAREEAEKKAKERARKAEYDKHMKKLLAQLTNKCVHSMSLTRFVKEGGASVVKAIGDAKDWYLIRFTRNLYKCRGVWYCLNFWNHYLTDKHSEFYYPEIAEAALGLRKAIRKIERERYKRNEREIERIRREKDMKKG